MADSAAPVGAGRVFISYRREETAYAGRLAVRPTRRPVRPRPDLQRHRLDRTRRRLRRGDHHLRSASCDVLLALIGEQWLTITDEQGTARLDDPDDFVRLEIEAALTRDVRVIPILVAGARMPRPDQLPPSLAKLVRRHALELSPSHFEFDTSRLHEVLDKSPRRCARPACDHRAKGRRRHPASVGAGALRRGPCRDAARTLPNRDRLAR